MEDNFLAVISNTRLEEESKYLNSRCSVRNHPFGAIEKEEQLDNSLTENITKCSLQPQEIPSESFLERHESPRQLGRFLVDSRTVLKRHEAESISEFVRHIVPRRERLDQCRMYRAQKDNQVYYLYEEIEEGERFLLRGTRRQTHSSKSPEFLISTSREEMSDDVIAKVKLDVVSTNYTIYEYSGAIEKEIAAISFESKNLGNFGPKKFKVMIPRVLGDQDALLIEREKEKAGSDLVKFLKSGNKDKFEVFHNKEPVWSKEAKAYTLNFNGRVRITSVKNFQVVSDDDISSVLLQFGKVDKNHFILDFKYPFSPLQAFGIVLANLAS